MIDEKQLTEMAAKLVENSLDRLFASGQEILVGAKTQVRLKLRRTYSAYLKQIILRYGRAKSFFVRTEPTFLYDFYAPLGMGAFMRWGRGWFEPGRGHRSGC